MPGQRFSLGSCVSSINKTEINDIAELLLTLALNTHNTESNNLSNEDTIKDKLKDIKRAIRIRNSKIRKYYGLNKNDIETN
jgi:hypothetical protein